MARGMRCGACGTDLIAGKPFCHACGVPAPRRCEHCGAALEPGFRFCPECGTAVVGEPAAETEPADGPTPSAEGERKNVTVLFCDLVGSTAIAERLDPEDYHALLEKFLAVAFPAVYRFEGVVNQLAGDGLMALFGAPVAHEDDPQRAVRAALAVRDAVHGLAERVAAEGGPSLTVRIGVHTGPVVVGSLGTDLKAEYTAIGDTTNLAARLQGAAKPGGILISEATQRLVRGFFEMEFAGSYDIKGKSEPVRAYEVHQRTSQATAMSVAAERGLTPLVGRSEPLDRLVACFGELERGRSQVVTVVGDAGLGKSRLLYELRCRLRDESATFFEAYSSSMARDVPYHPVMEMLRRYFRLEAHDSSQVKREKLAAKLGFGFDRLERMYPRLSRFLALPADDETDLPGDELKRETFDAVGRLVIGVSQREPVVVFLEDLHWFDSSSLELLHDLIGRLRRSRLMIVATVRPDHEVSWRTRAVQTVIRLQPLASPEIRAMARGLVGATLPRAMEDLIVSRAAGSPFFVEELTRSLLEEGYVTVDADGRCRLTREPRDIPVPGTVQEVIAVRLDRLLPDEKRVLQVASVLGRAFRVSDLTILLGGESIDVARALDALEERGLLHRKLARTGDELRFGESLTQEVAYEGLLLRQRRQLHARVARLLESVPEGAGAERSALLAHHLALSDDRRRAVTALLQAARDAEAMPSYETAASFYERAATLADAVLEEQPDEAMERAALEAHFGCARLTVLFGLPLIAGAKDAAERGRVLAERLGETERLSSLLYFQGVLTLSLPGGDLEGGLALAEQAVALADRSNLPVQASRLRRGLAVNYVLDGRFEEAQTISTTIVGEFDHDAMLEDPTDIFLSTRWAHGFVLYASDQLDEALDFSADTLEAARRIDNRTVQCIAGAMNAQIHFLRAEYVQAKELADQALGIAEAIGNVNVYPAAAAIATAARTALGDTFDPARYLALIDRGLDPGGLVQMNFRFVSDAWILAGEAEAGAARLHDAQRNSGGRFRRALLAISFGDVRAALGDGAAARSDYEQALALATEMGARSLAVQATVGLAEAGEPEPTLRPALERALTWCAELRLERYRPRVLRQIERLSSDPLRLAVPSS